MWCIFVGVVMSLMAIVFGYDAICGEKELGTLRLMVSYGVPRDTILLGKWIGGVAVLLLPFVLTMLVASVAVMVHGAVNLTADQWTRLGYLILLSMLYMIVMYSMAMWVSAITRRAATSVMILVTVWLVLVLAIPNLAPYLAAALVPGEDPMHLEDARMLRGEAIFKEEITDKMAAYDKAHGFDGDGPWWRQVNWNDLDEVTRARRREVYEQQCRQQAYLDRLDACVRIDEDYQRKLDRQIALSRWLGRVSPFSSFAMAAAELTDTGMVARQSFIDQLRSYQHTLCGWAMDQWIARDRAELDSGQVNYSSPGWPTDAEPIPRFTYQVPTVSDTTSHVLIDAGLLVVLTVVFVLLGIVTFWRYDVR